MSTTRRETSADSAARFLASRYRIKKPYRRRSASGPRRIAVDFAEPTLRAVHEALLEQLLSCHLVGDMLNRTIIAEQMVAMALGEPPCDDPPLTDRGIE